MHIASGTCHQQLERCSDFVLAKGRAASHFVENGLDTVSTRRSYVYLPHRIPGWLGGARPRRDRVTPIGREACEFEEIRQQIVPFL